MKERVARFLLLRVVIVKRIVVPCKDANATNLHTRAETPS